MTPGIDIPAAINCFKTVLKKHRRTKKVPESKRESTWHTLEMGYRSFRPLSRTAFVQTGYCPDRRRRRFDFPR